MSKKVYIFIILLFGTPLAYAYTKDKNKQLEYAKVIVSAVCDMQVSQLPYSEHGVSFIDAKFEDKKFILYSEISDNDQYINLFLSNTLKQSDNLKDCLIQEYSNPAKIIFLKALLNLDMEIEYIFSDHTTKDKFSVILSRRDIEQICTKQGWNELDNNAVAFLYFSLLNNQMPNGTSIRIEDNVMVYSQKDEARLSEYDTFDKEMYVSLISSYYANNKLTDALFFSICLFLDLDFKQEFILTDGLFTIQLNYNDLERAYDGKDDVIPDSYFD